MSSNFSNAQITEWSKESHIVFAQMNSLLRDSVRTVTGVEGSTYKFQKLSGGSVTNNKSADADLTLAGVAHSVATATLTTVHAPERFDDLLQWTTSIDLRRDYFTKLNGLVSREFDNRIITAVDATATGITLTSNTFDAAGLAKIAKTVNAASVPIGDRVLVLPPAAIEDMMGDTKLSSRDYIGQKVYEQGFVDNVSGFRVIVMQDQSLLPTGTGTHYGYAFHKSAVGLAIGKDISTEFERIAHKDAWQVLVKALAGAVTCDTCWKFEIAD